MDNSDGNWVTNILSFLPCCRWAVYQRTNYILHQSSKQDDLTLTVNKQKKLYMS